jgi:hypothetical protein
VSQPDPIVAAFVAGALVVGFLTAGLFFLKFWRQTHDGLFAAFAAAFALLAANQAAPVLLGLPTEAQAPVYLLRLAAFALIIWAVLRKNLQGR